MEHRPPVLLLCFVLTAAIDISRVQVKRNLENEYDPSKVFVNPEECFDRAPGCGEEALQGFCKTNWHYMEERCPWSCRLCRRAGGDIKECKDQKNQCKTWKKEGDCKKRRDFMTQNCKKSCEMCGPESNYIDEDSLCPREARYGYCKGNTQMALKCPHSCHKYRFVVYVMPAVPRPQVPPQPKPTKVPPQPTVPPQPRKMTAQPKLSPQLLINKLTDIVSNLTHFVNNSTDIVKNSTNFINNLANFVSNSSNLNYNSTEFVGNTTNLVNNSTDLVDNSTNTVSNSTNTISNSTNHVNSSANTVQNSSNIVTNNSNVGINKIKNQPQRNLKPSIPPITSQAHTNYQDQMTPTHSPLTDDFDKEIQKVFEHHQKQKKHPKLAADIQKVKENSTIAHPIHRKKSEPLVQNNKKHNNSITLVPLVMESDPEDEASADEFSGWYQDKSEEMEKEKEDENKDKGKKEWLKSILVNKDEEETPDKHANVGGNHRTRNEKSRKALE